jgi:hypothetical protein
VESPLLGQWQRRIEGNHIIPQLGKSCREEFFNRNSKEGRAGRIAGSCRDDSNWSN